jgi:hypothetical protein
MMSKSKSFDQLAVVHPKAAGIDVGSREIWVAVPPDRTDETIRCFATFTPDLHGLADWLAACNVEIERRFAAITARWETPADLCPLPAIKPNARSKNKTAPSARQELFRITGVDLVAVDGINANLAQIILSEIGTDMSRFPSVKQFAAWLGLAPRNDISGGKVLRSRTLKTHNRAGQAFRQAAASLTRSNSAFGAFYRRKRAVLGPAQAMVATAHRIARSVYFMLKYKVAYQDLGAAAFETQHQQRELTTLKRRAAKLGFELTAKQPLPSLSSSTVS